MIILRVISHLGVSYEGFFPSRFRPGPFLVSVAEDFAQAAPFGFVSILIPPVSGMIITPISLPVHGNICYAVSFYLLL